MAIEIKINIEGLDQLTESLALIGSALAYKSNMINTSSEAANLLLDVTEKVEDFTEEEKIKREVVEKVVKTIVEAPKESEGDSTNLTIEDIREVFMAKNSKENTPKLKKILTDFGVRKVTDLKEKDFAAVLKALEEI